MKVRIGMKSAHPELIRYKNLNIKRTAQRPIDKRNQVGIFILWMVL